MYRYHCQHQAENFARCILPVPKDYPMKKGLPKDFRERFAMLCDLARDIYLDMSKFPENYGLKLIDINDSDYNKASSAQYSIYRFGDTLRALFSTGTITGDRLEVPTKIFHEQIKRKLNDRKNNDEFLARSVSSYELILARMSDFGFLFSDFNGKPYRNIDFFTVEYPDTPEMLNTIDLYVKCWEELQMSVDKELRVSGDFQREFYLFDYKITAERDAISQAQLNNEYVITYRTAEVRAFAAEFNRLAAQYKDVRIDGHKYLLKSKRIAVIYDTMRRTPAIPDLRLEIGGRNDPQQSFSDFSLERVPYYWQLLETQYDLKKLC